MDGATIMFIGDTYCKAYNISYLNANYNKIMCNLQSVKKIYYKCNESRNSWINYKKALVKEQNKNLSYIERILRGLKNDFLSEEEFQDMPECEYTDYCGFTYTIGARDGLDDATSVKQLKQIYQNNIQKKIEYDVNEECYRLTVNFRTPIDDSLVTFNGLFEPFERIKDAKKTTMIVYYERDGLVFPKDSDGNYKEDWCYILPYVWNGVTIDEEFIYPIRREDEWLVFNEEIDSSYLIVYNKCLYQYEVNKYDSHYIKIGGGIDIGNSNNFKLEDIYAIKLRSEDDQLIKQQKLIGFYNEHDDTVYFPESIENALITYNGIHHSYMIKPNRKSIKFKIPGDLVLDTITGVDEESHIIAVNLYTGPSPVAAVDFPSSDLARAANQMIDIYRNKLKQAEDRVTALEKTRDLIYDDFNEQLEFSYDNPTTFTLSYIPDPKSLRLYINNVEYEKDIYFTYDADNKSIEWIFTEMNDGFDLSPEMEINVVYDLYYSVNNITDIDTFKEYIDSVQS
jgi:hypothetical protein